MQAVMALTGLSDEQAQSQAQKQQQNLVNAFNRNVADLGVQRGRNLDTFTDQANKANLTYGGYRVKGEDQLSQDYQGALSRAAAAEQGDGQCRVEPRGGAVPERAAPGEAGGGNSRSRGADASHCAGGGRL
jgi:hypothetical protein